MMQKLENSLWYLLVFFFSFQTVWIVWETFVEGEKWQYGTGLVYISDVFLVLLFVVISVRYFLEKSYQKKQNFDGIDALFFGFIFWSWASLLWAIDGVSSFFSALLLTKGSLVFFFVRSRGISLKKTSIVFFLALILHGALGIVQWTNQYVYEIKPLGIAQHDPGVYGTTVIKGDEHRWLRVYGGFPHPNIFGGFLGGAFFLALFLFFQEKREVRSVYFVMSLFFLFVLFLTFSRVSFVGIFLGGMVLFWGMLFFQKKDRFLKRIPSVLFFQSMVIMGVFVGIILYGLQEPLALRVSPEVIERESSASDRSIFIQQALSTIQQHPFLGVGVGNFTAYTAEVFWEDGDYIALFQPVHNIFLLVFSELGIVGFSLWTLFLIAVFWKGFSRYGFLGLGVGAFLIPFLFFDHWFFTTHSGFLLLGGLLGFLARKEKKERNL